MKSPQKPIPRVSPKKASKGFPKRSAVKKVNPARRRKEFERCYHSKERVEFVKNLPCAACTYHEWNTGYRCENAHVCGNGGMGRKGDYTTIAPLCGRRPGLSTGGAPYGMGCHRLFDEYRSTFDSLFPDFNPETAAQQTEQAWIAHSQEKA